MMQVKATLLDRAKDRLDPQVKVLLKNSSWLLSANALRAVLSVLRSVIVARGLGLELYGMYVIIVELVSTVQSVYDTTIGTTIIKFGADYKAEGRIDKLMALIKIGGLVALGSSLLTIATVVVIAYTLYDVFLEEPGLEKYLILYAAAAAMVPLDHISGSLLRLYDRFRLNALISMTVAVLEVSCIALVLLMYPGDITLFFIVVLLAHFLNSLITNLAAIYELWEHFKAHLRARIGLLQDSRRELVSFVFSNSGSRTIKTLLERGDVILLGGLSTASAVGLYQIGKKLASSLLRFSDPLFNAVYPQVAALIADRRFQETRRFLLRVSYVLAAGGISAMVGALLFGDWVIVKVYGQEYAVAFWPFILHLFVTISALIFFWGLPVIFSLGKVHVRLVFNVIALFVGGGLALWLVPAYGVIGMAVAALIAKSFVVYSYAFVSLKYVK